MENENRNKPVNKTDQFTVAAFATIMQQLGKIDEKLERKIAYWKGAEAVDAFMKHVNANHRRPDNFDHPMRRFKAVFAEKNIAEITPNEVQGFLLANWGTAAPSTYNKRKVQLSAFFSFSVKELKRQGSPSFHNPCELVDELKENPRVRTGFVPVKKICELLDTFENPRHWLQVAIQLTAGLRVGEVLKLRPMDIQGRVLTLLEPKSGADKELAVIPEQVAVKLGIYIKYLDPRVPIFPTSRRAVLRLLGRHAQAVKLELTTHDLRRWCATFWERQGDIGMMRAVLRHSGLQNSSGETIITSLEGRYASGLSVDEIKARQDKYMEDIG